MAASERRCHYEVLGLAMECSADEIRSAYRKLALQLHPDKLIRSGLSQSEATAKFQELSHAYEVLSDPKERSWYDSHRSKILFADPSSNSVVPDLFAYFSNSAFSGYSSDSKKGFFNVYSEVFGRVYANELDFARKMGIGAEVREAPAMGDLGSPYAQATAFYGYWTGFTTVMDFCWADPYDAAAGPNRKSRRVMEEENKKARRKARREYNDTVRGLAEFVKKRDKRVIDMVVKKKEEEEKRKTEAKERRLREEREKLERAMAYEEPDWARVDSDDVGDDCKEVAEEEEAKEQDEELYCVVCGKKFKSEKQWKNHEQSKKHKEKVAQIRQEIVLEDEEDNDEEGDGNQEEVEELEEIMRDTVHIGSSSAKDDEEEKEENVFEEDIAEVNDKDESVAVVGQEEDEIGDLEAMLGGRKNRKKAASTLRKSEANNSDDDMEYNKVKSTRKSRRAKKGKNGEKESNGNDNETSTAEEKDDNSIAENEKQPSTNERVSKKGIAKSEANNASKSKISSKGKKAKGVDKNVSNGCEKCGEEFESKNKLHKHLSDTGHASLKNR